MKNCFDAFRFLWVCTVAVALCFGCILGPRFSDAGERPLVIVGESFPPYEFVRDGEVVGIDVDVVTAILNDMGIAHEYIVVPWVRAWEMVEQGAADAVLSTSRKEKRKPFLIYPEEDLWNSEFVFFVRKDAKRDDLAGFEDFTREELVVGVIKGNSYHERFWKLFPHQDAKRSILHPQLDEAVDAETNFRKLAAGRIDLFLIPRTIGLYTVKTLQLQDVITYYPDVLFSKGYPMPFATRSTYPGIADVAAEFERRLRAFKKTEEYAAIYDAWLR